MPRLNSVDDLLRLQERVKIDLQTKSADLTIITIGMGTCGQAAGAGDTLRAIENELDKRQIQAIIKTVGCIGMCVNEPLVDIQLPGQPRITYINVTPARAKRLVDEHLLLGQVVYEWALGFVPSEW
jgi:NADP-reducing hydrogenase subunit HndB